MSKRTYASTPDYRLELIEGYMRPVFDGAEPWLNEPMWELLLPFLAASAAAAQGVERGEVDEWLFESPEARITCTLEKFMLKSKSRHGAERKALKIELTLKETLGRWLFKCVWTEQQKRGTVVGVGVKSFTELRM